MLSVLGGAAGHKGEIWEGQATERRLAAEGEAGEKRKNNDKKREER